MNSEKKYLCSMLSEFQEFIAKENLFQPEDLILLAVSGGMDSVVMAELFYRSGYSFGIAHCNFSLRGKESDAEEVFVKNLAAAYGAAFHLKRFGTLAYAEDRKISVQMAARELRYTWFESILREHSYQYLATAHHQDDQLESFIINLSRGTGIAGLHGILPKTGHIVRPMMFTSRDSIEKYILAEKLEYREDSSNQETKYLRNRVRHLILPEMEKLNPGFRDNLNQTILNIRHAEQVYLQAVEKKRAETLKRQGPEIHISISELFRLRPLNSWAYELLSPFGFNAGAAENIVRSARGEPGRVFHSETHRLLIDRGNIIIVPHETGTGMPAVRQEKYLIRESSGTMREPVNLSWKVLTIHEVRVTDDRNVACLDLERITFPIQVRKWTRGDYFFPLGMSGRKKVSDFFIDEKFSRFEKERAWLLCSGDEIAWIIGHRIDERFKVTETTEKVMEIKLNSFDY